MLTRKVSKALKGSSRGISIVEVLIAVAILGLLSVAFLGGLLTAFKAISSADEHSVAQNLAQGQMEYVKSQDYVYDAISYNAISDIPTNYTIQVAAESLHTPDDGIQKITVTVSHQADVVFILEGYKVDR